MKILIDINHPAQVHLFKNLIYLLQKDGHSVLVTPRYKDVTMQLIQELGINYAPGTVRKSGSLNLLFELIKKTKLLLSVAKSYKPDLVISVGSAPAAWAARIIKAPHIAFTDNDSHAFEQYVLYAPITKLICTSTCYKRDLGKKQIRYNGYHELAYLHPNWFTPDPGVLHEAGISEKETYFIIRFVSWQASHDKGQHGFSDCGKKRLVDELSKLGKVIITSESPLPKVLLPFGLKISPAKMHDLLYFSSLYIGEGASMASEAAVLGVPSIYVNTITAGTLEEQEQRYHLLHRITNEEEAISMAVKLAKDRNARKEYNERAQFMLKEKVDVTEWMANLIKGLLK